MQGPLRHRQKLQVRNQSQQQRALRNVLPPESIDASLEMDCKTSEKTPVISLLQVYLVYRLRRICIRQVCPTAALFLTKCSINEVKDIHMSSFFSIHRPISLTTPIPHESSNKVFSSIFDAKAPLKARTADVIYTLSSTVDALENATSKSQNLDAQQMSSEEIDLRQAVTQASPSNSERPIHHLDIPAKTLHLNLQELAKNFRPFVPPPAPVPLDARLKNPSPEDADSQTETHAQPAPTQKSYSTTLTIHETSYPNGQKTYRTHTTPIIEEPTSHNGLRYLPPAPHNQPFLGRMRQRQTLYLDRMAEREGWMAISVKRQRKLKMKKHKYKKLMKRTKNLRRRLDRT